MSNIRLIKRRIRVAKNISQITKAMEMVAASKMKKAQEKAVSGRPYALKIMELTTDIARKTEMDLGLFPLLKKNAPDKKTLVILISTNKGLCGGLNSALFRQLIQWFDNLETDFINFGEKGKGYLVRTGKNLVADFSSLNFSENIGALTEMIVSSYLKGEYSSVWLVFNNFLSVLNREPTREKILPIESFFENEEKKRTEALTEPSLANLLNNLLPHYLEVEIRRAILEAEACEHSARMMAMKLATDNAGQLMEDLTLEYNKARQQMITYELADITTARETMRE